jgi:RND family efflux transporter MFP subunit
MCFCISVFGAQVYATFDVVGIKESKLSLNVTGTVSSIKVKRGDIVKKGDVLLKLDSSLILAQLRLASSEVAVAKVNLEQAKSHYERYKKIQNVIDKERFEDLTFAYQKAMRSLDSAKKKEDLQKEQLNKRVLVAPYKGVVSDLHVEVGDGVAGPSMPLISIISYPKVKLVLSFDEQYWGKVKVGDKFIYTIDGSDKKFEGVISKVYPNVNPTTRKMKAEVLSPYVPSGLFGDGQIIIE